MRIISGEARGRTLFAPAGDQTRPTSDKIRGSLFNILNGRVEDAEVLDLFGGTGQLGIEALSRGAKSAVFVDAREEACRLIRENLKRTRLQEDATVVRSDYMDYLNRCREQFNIIFLDPPYAEVFLENSLNRITEIDILLSGGIIVAERPLGKALPWDFPGFTRSRDYQYGKILLTFYRKDGGSQE